MKKGLRIGLFVGISGGIIGMIAFLFWKQEVKYLLPTPVPENHMAVALGARPEFGKRLPFTAEKPLFLHFFQKSCPCSRFNVKEFKRIVKKFGDVIDFRIVLQSTDPDAVNNFIAKHEVGVEVLHDPEGIISDAMGVYSTPQAVIIGIDSILYYRGNYNQARFCTNQATAFADIALDSLLAGRPLPAFTTKATTAYGCALPSDSMATSSIFEMLKF